MERKYEVGQHIKYIDGYRKAHNALVLIWWMPKEQHPHYNNPAGEPGCNLVMVDPDPQKDDTYGRQILRETSVVHISSNPAGGNCWCWPDEVP